MEKGSLASPDELRGSLVTGVPPVTVLYPQVNIIRDMVVAAAVDGTDARLATRAISDTVSVLRTLDRWWRQGRFKPHYLLPVQPSAYRTTGSRRRNLRRHRLWRLTHRGSIARPFRLGHPPTAPDGRLLPILGPDRVQPVFLARDLEYGYLLDAGLESLRSQGFSQVLVDINGNVVVHLAHGRAWEVRLPWLGQEERTPLRVHLRKGALLTLCSPGVCPQPQCYGLRAHSRNKVRWSAVWAPDPVLADAMAHAFFHLPFPRAVALADRYRVEWLVQIQGRETFLKSAKFPSVSGTLKSGIRRYDA